MSDDETAPDSVRAILTDCASCDRRGRPYRCQSSKDGEDRTGSEGKVVYLRRGRAEEAARRFGVLDGRPSYPYQCPYSRRRHYHLTSMRTTSEEVPR